MHLVIGGAYQGKTEYVLKKYELDSVQTVDGADCIIDDFFCKKAVFHLHEWIKKSASDDKRLFQPEFWEKIDRQNPDLVLICDEVGCGVVPIDEKERQYREATGRLTCLLAKQAESVERIYCGIGTKLK